MASKKNASVVVDDVSGTNRVMMIVGLVVLITFITVMVILFSRDQETLVVPRSVKKVVVELNVKNRGKIQLELRNDFMPKTVNTFVGNIIYDLYKGRKFFRVDNYMTMAGSPTDEAGFDNGQPVPLESHPEMKVERYAIGMGKDTKANLSSSAIFFIAKAREADFDGKYAVFGKVANVASEKVLDSLQLKDIIESAKVLTFDDQPYASPTP
ncbi:MAG: peptidylprolyl isomerase [Clostridia bacterium]